MTSRWCYCLALLWFLETVFFHFLNGNSLLSAGVGKCPFLGICFTSPSHISVGDYIPFLVGWCETLGHWPTPVQGIPGRCVSFFGFRIGKMPRWVIPQRRLFWGQPDFFTRDVHGLREGTFWKTKLSFCRFRAWDWFNPLWQSHQPTKYWGDNSSPTDAWGRWCGDVSSVYPPTLGTLLWLEMSKPRFKILGW